MKKAHNHIIEKVFVEINTNNSEKAFGVKDNIGTFLNEMLFRELKSCLKILIQTTGFSELKSLS